MCSHPECLEGIEFGPEGSSIQVGYGYIDGRKFSAIVRDSRYEGREHLHFPAQDFDRFAQAALRNGGDGEAGRSVRRPRLSLPRRR